MAMAFFVFIQNFNQLRDDVLGIFIGIECMQFFLTSVIIQNGPGIGLIHLHPILDGFGVIMRSLIQLPSARIADTLNFWRTIDDVVRCAAIAADAPAG